jgi:hypothetical protein
MDPLLYCSACVLNLGGGGQDALCFCVICGIIGNYPRCGRWLTEKNLLVVSINSLSEDVACYVR